MGVYGVGSGAPDTASEGPFWGRRSVGVFGKAGNLQCLAGWFSGDVVVWGRLVVGGGKSFLIDHPLDPENRYLQHACVESPEPLNICRGTVVTDDNGQAAVQLPAYFEALNTNVTHQLTVIGQFAQAVVSEEIPSQPSKPRIMTTVAGTSTPEAWGKWKELGLHYEREAALSAPAVEGPGTD
ncbi:hypothetical protein SGA01_26570 [Streptomyces gardneri]|uniref:Uncharacterized protein n=1 Tax=Streptomyces gardneri TaxID=66892 RepID=A0A4Y3RHA6_9ACTN|nr:hypothetical protein SGA01_26570 [Streptomyces gardneri]